MKEITKIKKALQDDNILEQLKNQKSYLLSEYEKKLLTIYLSDHRLSKYKKEFIFTFINRLKDMAFALQKSYFSKLADLCHLYDDCLNIQIGTVDLIDYNMPTKTTIVREKPRGFSKDAYFNEVLEKENYDELYNIYGLEQIERDSNLLDLGVKK